MNGEVYEIEERVDDISTHYEIAGTDIEDSVGEEELMDILRSRSTEIAIAWDNIE